MGGVATSTSVSGFQGVEGVPLDKPTSPASQPLVSQRPSWGRGSQPLLQGRRTHILKDPEIQASGLSSWVDPPPPETHEWGGPSRRPAQGGGPSTAPAPPSRVPATFQMAGMT